MQIHHIAFRCRDLQHTAHFYERLLGLARVDEQPGHAVWLSLDDGVLMLEQAAEAEPVIPEGSMELCAFRVDAARQRALRELLVASGVPIEDHTPHTIYFRDPDGRRVGASTYPL